MKELFHTLLFQPLYNALVFLIDIIPGGEVALAVIILTIIVKLILFPLSTKMVRSQMQAKLIQAPLAEINEKYKNDPQARGQAMLALYKEYNINPFAGLLVLIIQIPIIIALYWVFFKGGLPNFHPEWLYSFVPLPKTIDMHFLGIDMAAMHNVLIALAVGVSQYFQAHFSLPKQEPRDPSKPASFQDDMMRGMAVQVKYVLPVIIAIAAYNFINVLSVYWIVSNLFAIGQELYMRKHVRKEVTK